MIALPNKPLGRKAYGSIGHLPGSRRGPGDHGVNEGQARIATERKRDRHDVVTVQEKLDGSCVAAVRAGEEIIAINRAGYPAESSPYPQHHVFARWVAANQHRFIVLLQDGERAVGEWLALAHGTRYDLTDREPFVLFDIMREAERVTVNELYDRNWTLLVNGSLREVFSVPAIIANGPCSIEDAMAALGEYGFYGALDPAEGLVWRVERRGKVDFLAKYVRPDKVDGCYLDTELWNWKEGATDELFDNALER